MFRYWIVVAALACSLTSVIAQTNTPALETPPETVTLIPAEIPAPTIAASSYLLFEMESRQVLLASHADEPREPASLTKLMTAYLVFSALRDQTITMDQKIFISEHAKKAIGSRMFADPRVPVSVDELLHGMIIQSGNDASIALAELIAGDEAAFAALMNAQAQKMGMTKTNFVNSTGLSDPQHYSTASDLAKLASALIRDFPDRYSLYSIKEYRYNNITQQNRNRLLRTDPHVDGVKTGFTDSAGWCLIASAKRGERRLLSVVLGAASDADRAQENQKLLNWGYQAFDVVKPYPAGQPMSKLRAWKGSAREVPVGFLQDHYLSIPKEQSGKLKVDLIPQEPLIAPIQKGAIIGTVQVQFNDARVAEYPLVAQEEVTRGSWWRRLWDTILLWFK